jgi:hypothetical protein
MEISKYYYLLIIAMASSCVVFKPKPTQLKTPQNPAQLYSNTISIADLKEYLKKLSSDEFEGRETTTKGQKMAANYIKNHFLKYNISSPRRLETPYFQKFPVQVLDLSSVGLSINGTKLNFLEEFYSFGLPVNCSYSRKQIVLQEYSSTQKPKEVNFKGKVVLLLNDTNEHVKPVSWRKKINYFSLNGALAVILQKPNYKNTDLRIKNQIIKPYMKVHGNQKSKAHIPFFIVDDLSLSRVLKDGANTTSFLAQTSKTKYAENVLGFIPGKTDELVAISAHYDHLGYDNGQICNGADDDGSGTSSLMSIAKSFKLAHDEGFVPQRGILFLAFSGEEKGLFGSRYYTENPAFPLIKTVVDLNIDMVGRNDTLHDNNNYIYLIGSDRISKDLHSISEEVNNENIFFNLDYTYNKKDDPNRFYERSDHYNFAKNNIPVIFYFGGMHEDYHKPTDDFEKIDFPKLAKVTRYVFLTAWELAYRKERIK